MKKNLLQQSTLNSCLVFGLAMLMFISFPFSTYSQSVNKAPLPKHLTDRGFKSYDEYYKARLKQTDHEHYLANKFSSRVVLKKMMDDAITLAKVTEKDKTAFEEMLYEKVFYADRFKINEKINNGELTEANYANYRELKVKEYASYYENMFLKGETTFFPDMKTTKGDMNMVFRNVDGGNGTQSIACNNEDFETTSTTTVTGWTGAFGVGTGTNCNFAGTPNFTGTAGFNMGAINSGLNQHTFMTGGNDPVAGAALPRVSNLGGGGGASFRLGDQNDGCDAAELSKTFLVTAANTNFSYDYAVVMYDGHVANDAPKFRISMTDQAGNPIGCAAYQIDATQAANPVNGYIQSATFGLYYKPWSRVFVPLTAYIGQNVTIRFIVSDCNGTAHRGYAYLECTCAPFQLISSSPVICNGANTTLTAPGGAASYVWTVLGGGGNIVSGANSQVVTVNLAGQYQVTMQAFGSGCTYVIDTVVAGAPFSPIANFTTTTVCAGGVTNFTDLSLPNGGPPVSTWNWSFGSGGATSTAQNPTFTYPAPGLYTTTLTVANGCADTYTANVNVIAQPTAAFTAPAVCFGATTNFTNNSVNGTTYAWDFGDPGSGANNTSAITTPTHVFSSTASPFVVTLTVTATGGCTATTTQNIVVNALPVPSFNVTSVCQGANTTFNNLTPGVPAIANWGWDYENNGSVDNTTQSPSFTYPLAGNYTAVLTATTTAGCTGTFNAPVAVYPNPTANFSAPNVCQGFATAFTDLSVINPNPTGDAITQWIWGFGGQGVSNVQNPSFTFATCNTYNITLTAITNHACTNTFNNNITVFCKPTATFTAPPVCFGNNTTLTNTTVGATTTDWDFDSNGTVDNTTHPLLNYNLGNANTYNVSMIATNADGCKDTITQAVVVNPLPAPSYTASPVCSGVATNFGSTSTISSGTINTLSWDFGDATPLGAGTPVAHLYGASNTYTVTLTATSNNLCVSTYTNTIVVNPNPVASFTATTVCQGSTTLFTDLSTINPVTAGNTIIGWSWDFNGDGIPDNNANNPNNTFPTANTYPVTLTVTTNNNCVNTTTVNVLVHPNPVPSFATTGVCVGAVTTFNNTTPGNPAIQNWGWDFSNDGTIDNSTQSPTNTYPSFGTYNAILTATTTAGCVGMFNSNLDVYPLPSPNFTASNLICLGTPSQFTDLSSVPSNPGANTITNWAWDFDTNGSIDNVMQNPSNVMPNAGSTPVMLTVTTNHNCTANITMPIYVNYIPVAGFTVDDPDGCPVHPANFTDGSTITSGNVVSWVWNFGNAGGAVGQQPPTILFDNLSNTVSAYYPVTLTVKSDSGCVNTLTQANYIQVFPTPVADFVSTSPDPDSYFTLDPNFTFYNQSIGAVVYNWNFGDVFESNPLNNVSTAVNPTHYYASYEPYTYMVQLAVENIEGCKDTVLKPVEVKPAWTFYIPNCFTPNGDGTNDGFRGTGINLDEYNIWVFDRWGNMLWHCENLDTFWDGRVQGHQEVCQEDTYVWKVKFRDVFGQKHEKNGIVSIVK